MPATRSFGVPNLQSPDLEGLRSDLQTELARVYAYLDKLAGLRGDPEFFANISLQGNRITQVGMPQDATDAELHGQALHLSSDGLAYDAGGMPLVNVGAGTEPTNGATLADVVGAATPLASTAPPNVGAASVQGNAIEAARSDHTHGELATAAPPNVGTTSAVGTATKLAREDHTHGELATAAPGAIALAGAVGTTTKLAREDHTHAGTVTLRAYKPSDESVTSSTTLQDDDHLSVFLAATTKYSYEAIIFIDDAGALGGVKLALGGTVGVTSLKAQMFIYDDVLDTLVGFARVTALASSVGAALSTGSAFALIKGTIETSTSGTLLLSWAQNVSDGSATTVQRGSSFVALALGT